MRDVLGVPGVADLAGERQLHLPFLTRSTYRPCKGYPASVVAQLIRRFAFNACNRGILTYK
jgi:hypothetical protein